MSAPLVLWKQYGDRRVSVLVLVEDWDDLDALVAHAESG